MSKREFCPVSEIDWDMLYHQGRPGGNEPDPGGELIGIDRLVSQYQTAYSDKTCQDWIEKRLREWWQSREDR